jgi:hypothetical protein
VPFHQPPIRSFNTDVVAVAMGLALLLTLALSKRITSWRIPLIAVACIVPISFVPLQHLSGIHLLPQLAFAWILYLLWTAAMAVAAATVTGNANPSTVHKAIAIGLALAALGNGAGILLNMSPARAISLVGQPNRLATVLWLGTASIWHLYMTRHCSRSTAIIIAGILAALSVVSGSRMIYLFWIALASISTWASGMWGGGWHSRAKAISLIALGTIFLSMLDFMFKFFAWTPLTSIERSAPSVLVSDPRMSLWRETITMITGAPWLGIGAGNFRISMLDASSLAPAFASTFPHAEHAHNILLQLAAEFGIPAAILTVAITVYTMLQGGRATPRTGSILPLSLPAILSIHSMLEYPLWFLSYLGPLTLLLGSHTKPTWSIAVPRKLALGACLAAFGGLLFTAIDYGNLANILRGNAAPEHDNAALERMAKTSVFAPYAEAILLARLTPSSTEAAQQARLCSSGLHVWPTAATAGRCVLLLRMAGANEESERLASISRSAFRLASERRIFDQESGGSR